MEHKDDNAKNKRIQRAMGDIISDKQNREQTRKEKELEKEMLEQEEIDDMINELRHYSNLIGEAARKDIVYGAPWISYNDAPIIADGSVTLIQGKAKSHKSRLAETFCSLLLSPGKKQAMGFKRYAMNTGYCVAYIDTERAMGTDFAAALQRIKQGAGYSKTEQLDNLMWYSIKMAKREKRLLATKAVIQDARSIMQERGLKHYGLLVVLDVISDCVRSFNNDSDANEFYDYIGMLCETYGVSFLLILHENPGSDKARGHLGSEGMNKASSLIQIGYEKDSGGENTDLIKIKILANRNSGHLPPNYVQFKEGHLTAADPGRVKEVTSEKAKAGSLELAAEALERIFSGKTTMLHQELVSELLKELGVSERTVRNRIQDIMISGYAIADDKGRKCALTAQRHSGKATVYELTPGAHQAGERADGEGIGLNDVELPF
jgi:hypothetical protein